MSSPWILFLIFATCIFTEFALSSELCHVPPSLWCSSPDTITACKVEQQCASWNKQTQLVNFTLYYESLCPDCQLYIVGEFYRAFKKVGSLMHIELVPFGNSYEVKMPKGWIFACQHGPRECQLNKIEACAIKKFENSTNVVPFIHGLEQCLMKNGDDSKCVQIMSQKYDFDYNNLMICANGSAGMKYEHEMAVKTKALNPPNQYVPWVTLNGFHSEEIEVKAEKDLVALICETYQGPDKSHWCPTDSLQRCKKKKTKQVALSS